jgi:glycosyltransferase involved in cell wall biosynthesis
MRIGVMLRAYDRPGGIGIYSRNIVKHLLRVDRTNHYVLMYDNPDHVGTYGELSNVDEVYLSRSNPLIWDQWLTPRAAEKWGLELIFNTKFTVPLRTKAKTIMALHGASWFVHPELYGRFDVFYVRRFMPIYCRKADFLISNSDLTTRDHIRILGVPRHKIRTVYFAAGEEFRPIQDSQLLMEVKARYNLPDRFVLTVTSYDPVKNLGVLFDAFETCRQYVDVHFVVAGKNCEKYAQDFDLRNRGLEHVVHFPGWVDQKDLPAIYNLAAVYAFPSIYETFGIPVIEAISCGCPVVASNTGALPELLDDAALLSDPFDPKALAQNLLMILTSESLAAEFRKKGLARAKEFSWTTTAEQTLGIFRELYAQS